MLPRLRRSVVRALAAPPCQVRRTMWPAARALAVLVAVGCSDRKPPAPPANAASLAAARAVAVRDSVRTFLRTFADDMNAGRLEAVGALYSSDSAFSWIENGALRYRSAGEARTALETLRAIPQVRLVYYETHIEVLAPGVATVRTEFSQALLDKQGRGNTYGGFLTMTVVHEADGWRLRNGHVSSRRSQPGI